MELELFRGLVTEEGRVEGWRPLLVLEPPRAPPAIFSSWAWVSSLLLSCLLITFSLVGFACWFLEVCGPDSKNLSS